LSQRISDIEVVPEVDRPHAGFVNDQVQVVVPVPIAAMAVLVVVKPPSPEAVAFKGTGCDGKAFVLTVHGPTQAAEPCAELPTASPVIRYGEICTWCPQAGNVAEE
jgi:hypothetical protein